MDEPLMLATGKALALVATLLQRERRIDVDEFGDLLGAFGSVVAERYPDQGDILRTWSAMIKRRT